VLIGIETHICVLQTALDLLSRGYRVYVAADAVGSRHRIDHDVALQRLRDHGVIVTTAESVLFEWCETAEMPQFKAIRDLVAK
jgi:nicotinamidase-related amidase